MIHPLPAQVQQAPAQLGGADLVPGQLMSERRVLLDAESFSRFAQLSGDAHPLHYDAEYAAAQGLRAPIAHGLLLVAVSALGATRVSDQLHDSMVAMLGAQVRFLAPAFVDDTVTVRMKAGDVTPKSGNRCVAQFDIEIVSQDGRLLARLHHQYMLHYQLHGQGTS